MPWGKSNKPKLKKAPFKVGEVVETDYHYPKMIWIKHRVVVIYKNDRYGSGYGVDLEPMQKACVCCKRPFQSVCGTIDSAWCRKADE